MNFARVAAVAIGTALGTALPTGLSRAAEPVQAPSARSVELFVIGAPDRQKWFAGSLGPHSAAGATLSLSQVEHFDPSDVLRPPTDPSATLRCWVDLREATRARIYFSAHGGKRFLLRDLELSGVFDELDRESLSQVLASSWSALLEDEEAGLSREEARALLAQRAGPPAPVPEVAARKPPDDQRPRVPSPSTPSPRSSLSLRFAVFYGLQAFSQQLLVEHGPGFSISVGQRVRRDRLSLWLSGQYRLPETERGARVGVRLESIAARAGLELLEPLDDADLDRAKRELYVRAGAGLDFTHFSPEPGSVDSSAALTPARWATELVLTSSVGANTRLNQRAALGLRLFVDALPTLVAYDLRVGGRAETVLSPWHVRAGVALEIEAR